MGALAEKAAKTAGARISPRARNHVRVLTLDIETSPNLAYVFGLWQQNVSIDKIVAPTEVMCWAAKWYGEKPMFMSTFHDGKDEMVRGIHALLDEADIVVHYNGTSFDMPHLNREFLELGLTPPKPYKQVDLLKVVRKQFKFPSNKLDYVVRQLGLGGKVHHTGFQLWKDCMNDDPKAWALMKRYNLGDIRITEKLYDALRPWIPNHPHFGMFTGDEWSCSNCGHKALERDLTGHAHTNVQSYRAYQCPKCGTHMRSTVKLQDPTRTRYSR